ncbi:MAG: RNA polymerase sigma factor [Actinomycetota bacterium]
MGAVGHDRSDRGSHRLPFPRGARWVPDACARRAPGRAESGGDRHVDRPVHEVDLREDLLTMLRSLAPRQRAALVLLDLYGYGSEEAAAIMRIRPSTVRALATQGRAVLRTAGGPHG